MRILVCLLLFQSVDVQHHRSSVAPLSLAQIEALALSDNLEVRVAQERVKQARAGVTTAGVVQDPSFMYRGWGAPLTQPWNLNRTQQMFMLSQTIPGSGKRELSYVAAKQAVESAEAEVGARKLDVLARVRAAFYELLRNNDELRLHDEQAALSRQAVAAARIKYTAGRVPQQDVLKAQLAVTRLADHLVMFVQDGDLARARLNTLMGRDPSLPLEVLGDYIIPTVLPGIATLQLLAIENRPELRAIDAAIKQSETQVRLAEKVYKPDLTISGGYMLMPSGSPNRSGYMAELTVGLPWLNRSKHDSEIQQAQAAAGVQRAELALQKAFVLQEIQESLIRANSAKRLVELYRDTLRPQANATLRAASTAYQSDQTDFVSFIDTQNSALEVEYAYFRALAEFDSRISDLERAIGAAVPRTVQSEEGGVR